jgi:hypothetical protein
MEQLFGAEQQVLHAGSGDKYASGSAAVFPPTALSDNKNSSTVSAAGSPSN